MVVLPREEAKAQTKSASWVAHIEELLGKPFNKDAFSCVNHSYCMGGEDTEDNCPYETLWLTDLGVIARSVYGEKSCR
jgi:hypothetical protein